METMTWEQFERDMMQLAACVGYTPDIIVGVVRGGMIPARILSRELGVSDMFCMTVETLDEAGTRKVITDILIDLRGKQVLVVEDMLDKGKSMLAVKEYLEKKGAQVKTAALYTPPASELQPDFMLRQLEERVQFPWE